MKKYQELEKLCLAFDEGYKTIEPLVEKWGHSKKKITTVMTEIYRTYAPDNIVTEYPLASAYLYLISEFFQDPKAIGQLKAKHETELNAEGLSVLSFWEQNPAFWCYFSVKKVLSEDFSLIEDLLTGEEHTLYSPAINKLYGKTSSKGLRSLCLMLPNGKCLQTVGIIKSYRIPVSDFKFYCSLFKPQSSLKTILSKHYITFFKLDTIGNTPMLHYEGHHMGFVWQPFTLAEFDVLQLGGDWVVDTLGTQQRLSLDLFDSTMDKLPNRKLFNTTTGVMAGAIFRDTTTGEMGIFTNTEAAYIFFSALLNRAYPELKLHKKPSLFICAPLQTLLLTMDLPVAWKKFEKIIKYDAEPDLEETDDFEIDWKSIRERYDKLPSDEPMVQQAKSLLDVFLESRETGKPLDVDTIAKVTGMDKEDVEGILYGFEKTEGRSPFDKFLDDFFDEVTVYEVSPTDKKFELKNLPMPLDEEEDGEFLYQDLTDSALFTVNDIQKAEEQLVEGTSETFAEEIATYGILESIEELFTEEFDELDYPLMNTFFWVLLHKGKKWVPFRSYAIEMLKWIPDFILEEYDDDEEFINEFGLFLLRKLYPLGLCSLEKKLSFDTLNMATYKIKGTDAFYSMLKISDDVVLDT